MIEEPKICRRSMLAALILLCMIGCAKRDSESSYVKIRPTIHTRVSTLGFEAGDRIGLTILRAAEPYAENCPMTYDGTAFAGALQWYAARQEASTLLAYHPYSEAGVPERFTIAADQRSGCESSDLLGAVKTEVLPGTMPVGMVFEHLLAQLSVIVTGREDNPVVEVVLSGTVPVADVDLAAQRAVVSSGVPASEVRACEVRAGLSYRAVLVPQCADLTLTLTAADGAVLTKTLSAATLQGGCRYDVEVEWTDEGAGFLMSGGIGDWADGGTIVVGEDGAVADGSEGGAASDAAGTLHYEGETYRTQRIGGREWMAENLRYLPDGMTPGEGVRYPAAGAEAVAEKGLLYDWETASAGASADFAAPLRGICPPGWHIPSRAELEELTGCEAGFFGDAGCWIEAGKNSKYGTSSYLMSSTLSADGTQMECLNDSKEFLAFPVRCGVSLRCVKDE